VRIEIVTHESTKIRCRRLFRQMAKITLSLALFALLAANFSYLKRVALEIMTRGSPCGEKKGFSKYWSGGCPPFLWGKGREFLPLGWNCPWISSTSPKFSGKGG